MPLCGGTVRERRGPANPEDCGGQGTESLTASAPPLLKLLTRFSPLQPPMAVMDIHKVTVFRPKLLNVEGQRRTFVVVMKDSQEELPKLCSF